MSYATDFLTFSVPLTMTAHQLAEQASQPISAPKAKQAYLNTLAIYVVDFYLNCMGIETRRMDAETLSLQQTLADAATLELANLGKLECRPVLPNADIILIPPEVWHDRIGYVAVQFHPSLQEATLLGFVQTAVSELLPIQQLQSLDKLLERLEQLQIEQSCTKVPIKLSQWVAQLFEADWQAIAAVFSPVQSNLVFSFRVSRDASSEVQRAKLIDLGMELGDRVVALLVSLMPEADQKVGIRAQLHPVGEATHLPANLELVLLSEAGTMLQEVRSRSQDNYIQLKRFKLRSGQRFSIQVVMDQISMTEHFLL